jgi:hypothetical protein
MAKRRRSRRGCWRPAKAPLVETHRFVCVPLTSRPLSDGLEHALDEILAAAAIESRDEAHGVRRGSGKFPFAIMEIIPVELDRHDPRIDQGAALEDAVRKSATVETDLKVSKDLAVCDHVPCPSPAMRPLTR